MGESFGISIDRAGRLSLSDQIADGIRDAIREGRLAPDARLPSWNDLATQLGVARGTVRSAYERLADGQFIVAAGAAGTRVARRPPALRLEPEPPRTRRAFGAFASGPTLPGPFQVGVPAADLFPAALWSRLHAQAARDAAMMPAGYPDPRGEPKLRAEIAGYLAVARGFACRPSQVFVTNGYAGALGITLRALKLHGAQAWVEDPGYPFARTALAWEGLTCVPVPVDGEGMDVAAGMARAPDARVAMVTPGQQAPLGMTLSLDRRHALLDWAHAGDRWIVEDDYLGELQLARRAARSGRFSDRGGGHAGSRAAAVGPAGAGGVHARRPLPASPAPYEACLCRAARRSPGGVDRAGDRSRARGPRHPHPLARGRGRCQRGPGGTGRIPFTDPGVPLVRGRGRVTKRFAPGRHQCAA